MSNLSPSHYGNNWNVGDFIREQKLNFHLGNAIKYICRADHKGCKASDLNKAIHYLQNELQSLNEKRLTAISDAQPSHSGYPVPTGDGTTSGQC